TASGAINGATNSVEAQKGNVSASTNGSYTKVDQSATFKHVCTNVSRIAWVAYGEDGGFSGSYFYYIYLDNIKVSIAQ
ncbi:MAG: hypothetical protein RR199_07090, partial [Alistipes sp.]